MKKIAIILLLYPFACRAQLHDSRIRLKVLNSGIIGHEYKFGKWNGEKGDETHLKYLGDVTTKNGRLFKIMNSTWIWGLARRTTNRILIFDERNHYLGDYYVDEITDLPKRLKDGKLIFSNRYDGECDKNLSTIVSLKNGLPCKIFLKCKCESDNIVSGDFYVFESN